MPRGHGVSQPIEQPLGFLWRAGQAGPWCFAFAFEGFFARGRGNISCNQYFWQASPGFRAAGLKEPKSSLRRQPRPRWQRAPGAALAGDEAGG